MRQLALRTQEGREAGYETTRVKREASSLAQTLIGRSVVLA